MAYSKPPSTNISFKFTSSGYIAPYANSVPFRFGPRAFADLKAAVDVLSYDYVKECPTIIIGYDSFGKPQILQLPCKYGGIRDIKSTLNILPPNVDLSAYIYSLNNFLNLVGYIKSTIQAYKNIYANIYAVPPKDLSAFLHGWDILDLPGNLHAFHSSDMEVIIGAHLPINLTAEMNIIELRDLTSYIYADWWHGVASLGGEVYKIFQRGISNLSSFLHGWAIFDLASNIGIVYKADLSASLRSSTVKHLMAAIYSIAPMNLSAFIHSFDTSNLAALLVGGYGPYDIQAFLNAIPSVDLKARLSAFKGIKIPVNLKAMLSGWQQFDLSAVIGMISALELQALINVIGKTSDLSAQIIPKTIRLKKVIQIPLLEHKDLKALINFQCFQSTFVNLNAYLYMISKKDLRAFIAGWKNDDGYKNLGAFINAAVFFVEDKLSTNYLALLDNKYASLKLKYAVNSEYKVVDVLNISLGTFFGKSLGAFINSIPRNADISASIRVVMQPNYTELPPYINPKTHEVVIDLNDRGKENWRAFVELMFNKTGDTPFQYFYISGTNKIYKLERERHWTIWASNYKKTQQGMREKIVFRQKFIFNLSNYNTVDAAIRDLIDRVSTYRYSELGGSINASYDRAKNLTAFLEIRRPVYKWITSLNAAVLGVDSSTSDCTASIYGAPPSKNLSANLTALTINDTPLNFTGSGYIPDNGDDVLLNFD